MSFDNDPLREFINWDYAAIEDKYSVIFLSKLPYDTLINALDSHPTLKKGRFVLIPLGGYKWKAIYTLLEQVQAVLEVCEYRYNNTLIQVLPFKKFLTYRIFYTYVFITQQDIVAAINKAGKREYNIFDVQQTVKRGSYNGEWIIISHDKLPKYCTLNNTHIDITPLLRKKKDNNKNNNTGDMNLLQQDSETQEKNLDNSEPPTPTKTPIKSPPQTTLKASKPKKKSADEIAFDLTKTLSPASLVDSAFKHPSNLTSLLKSAAKSPAAKAKLAKIKPPISKPKPGIVDLTPEKKEKPKDTKSTKGKEKDKSPPPPSKRELRSTTRNKVKS